MRGPKSFEAKRLFPAVLCVLVGSGPLVGSRSLAAGERNPDDPGGANGLADLEPAPDPAKPDPGPDVRFYLSDARGKPGDVVTLELSVFTDTPIKAIGVALNFDESRLRSLEVRTSRQQGDDANVPVAEADLRSTDQDNRDEEKGNQTREGWIYIELERTAADAFLVVDENSRVPLMEIDFLILGDALYGVTEIKFESVVNQKDVELNNFVVVGTEMDGAPAVAALGANDVEQGRIAIIGEVGFFMRGDVDMSCSRDLTDPVLTLNYLFLGEREPGCLDAADSNDSGDVDLSDPVFSLLWLFTGGTGYPEPYRLPGPDPTDDDRVDCVDGLPEPQLCGPSK